MMANHNKPILIAPALKISHCTSFWFPATSKHNFLKRDVFVKGGVDLRDKMMMEINEKGVPCYSGSCSEVYLEKAFDTTGFRPKERLPVAKELGETSLMFLVHPTLTKEEIQKTCDILTEVALANYDD